MIGNGGFLDVLRSPIGAAADRESKTGRLIGRTAHVYILCRRTMLKWEDENERQRVVVLAVHEHSTRTARLRMSTRLPRRSFREARKRMYAPSSCIWALQEPFLPDAVVHFSSVTRGTHTKAIIPSLPFSGRLLCRPAPLSWSRVA